MKYQPWDRLQLFTGVELPRDPLCASLWLCSSNLSRLVICKDKDEDIFNLSLPRQLQTVQYLGIFDIVFGFLFFLCFFLKFRGSPVLDSVGLVSLKQHEAIEEVPWSHNDNLSASMPLKLSCPFSPIHVSPISQSQFFPPQQGASVNTIKYNVKGANRFLRSRPHPSPRGKP